MPFLILTVLIQVAFVIHVVKTGRNTTWIWIVLMLPIAGALAYLILEVLPDAGNTRTGRRAKQKVSQALNPDKDLNQATRAYQRADTVENAMNLANACLDKGLYQEAQKLFDKALQGPLADDPHLMFGAAKAEFGLGNLSKTKELLDKLIESNPDFKDQDAHLLYARSLDGLQQINAAQHEYEALYNYYMGPDAMFYFAEFLAANNNADQAQSIYSEIVTAAADQNRHYRELHADIIRKARLKLH
ncbi:MAG: tetratricopeptide repeat protein [Cellvibrionaceae bacterium]|nr:tetratricopeptide repeat protein [Cellvibrionaceae bacterium]